MTVAIQALQTIAEQVSEDISRNIVRANDNANQEMSGVEVANKAAKDLQGQSSFDQYD